MKLSTLDKENEMDYEKLLKKYMNLVLDAEGVTFVDFIGHYDVDVAFTLEEKAELERIHEEVCK